MVVRPLIGKLVRVTWHDAHGIDGWISMQDIEREPRCITSVGWTVVGIKPGHVVLVASVDDDMVDGGLAIPHGMVREIVELCDGARIPLEGLH